MHSKKSIFKIFHKEINIARLAELVQICSSMSEQRTNILNQLGSVLFSINRSESMNSNDNTVFKINVHVYENEIDLFWS